MSKFKLMSAGLVAAAMLTAPVMARENHLNTRHVARDAYASVGPVARDVDGRFCYPAPRVDAFATAPWENETPCEPASAPAY